MPSLREQLQSLQAPVSRSLGVEKERASLLFDRKEAASFSSEEFYNLGLSGLEQLRKVDRSLADYEEKLFDQSSIVLNRAILSKQENDELNESLERMIIYLSPYFNHQGCKQVLEWLIHKYHIHLYNAPVVINAFIIYHSTNSFGRLLKIMKIDRPEWEFTKQFSKEALPIPFSSIVKACIKGGSNHFLIASYSSFLQQAIELVGEDYVGERMQMHFTFFASLVVHLFEDTANITEELISRIIPFVGAALKSTVLPFKLSGFMIVCDLAMNTSLSEDILTNILKLTMLKMRKEWFEVAMNVILVICQRQNIKSLPKKPLLKLIRNGDALNLSQYLADALSNFDLTGFVLPFVSTLFECLAEEEDIDTQNLIISYVKVVLELEAMNNAQASAVIHGCFQHFLADENGQIPEGLRLLLKQIVIRFVQAFDPIRAEMSITNSSALTHLMEQCSIGDHEIGILSFEDKKKRRRRSSHSRNFDDDVSMIDETEEVEKKPDKIPKIESQLKNLQEGGDVQKSFKKSPSVVLEFLKEGDAASGKLQWALSAFESDKYLAKQSEDELEDFLVGVVRFVSKEARCAKKSLLKESLLKIKISDKVLMMLISPHKAERAAKRGRFAKPPITTVFENESEGDFENRLLFVLDVLIDSIALKATKDLMGKLFDLIEIADKPIAGYETIKDRIQVQRLVLVLMAKILKSDDANSLVDEQMNFTPLVNVIQYTNDTKVSQNALKVLASVAPLIPVRVTTQVMSLFTFMGKGLLKKDDELTLKVVEEALHALFSAILTSVEKKPAQYQKTLLDVSHIFAKTLPDIPVHRHSRLLKALASCILPDYLWIIFSAILNVICLNWKNIKQENDNASALFDNCLDFIVTLQPEQQIQLALNSLEYIQSLGGDVEDGGLTKSKHFPMIFDRKQNTDLKKLRHYRYTVFGFVLKIFSKKELPIQLSELTNNEIYERISPKANYMMEILASLQDFVTEELSISERTMKATKDPSTSVAQAHKYWVALSTRANNIVKKLRELLPVEVRIRLLTKYVKDEEIDEKLRERAPVLLDVNLATKPDAVDVDMEPESFEDQLNNLVEKMNASMKMPLELTELSLSLEKLLGSQEASDHIDELAPQLFPLFFELLNIRQNCFKSSSNDEILKCEQAVSTAFNTLAESVQEEDFKPVFDQLSEWVESALKPESKLKSRHRILTVYGTANRFYDRYKNLALGYFSQLFVYAPKILKQLNVEKTDSEELLIDGTSDENSIAEVVDQLIVSVIDFITNCAKHTYFIGEDRVESVYEAVLDEIENYKVKGHKNRCAEHLVDCIYQLSSCAPDLFTSSICDKLLEKMQNKNSHVRLQAAVIFEKLVGRFGDGLAPLLPNIVPYVSELLEDSNKKVAEQADSIINQLRVVFGEDIMNDR